jgi:prophage regulatory protein
MTAATARNTVRTPDAIASSYGAGDMSPQTTAQQPSRLISVKEVQTRTSLSRATIWRKVRAGAFPPPVSLGTRVAWRESEVTAWIDAARPR